MPDEKPSAWPEIGSIPIWKLQQIMARQTKKWRPAKLDEKVYAKLANGQIVRRENLK